MDESFDPYRKWLGIPPEEQPPHHYRLLGLELFEEDPDVIVNAADARLSYLQSLSKDKHADMADRLTAQIKEVQLCLLDPAKKAFYDGQLQRRIAALKKGLPATAATPNGAVDPSANLHGNTAGIPVPLPLQQTATAAGAKNPQFTPSADFAIPELQIPAYSPHSARPPRKRWHQVAAIILGLVAIGCLLVFLLVKFRAAEGTTPDNPVARAVSGGEKSEDVKPASSASPGNSTAGNSTVKPANPSGIGIKNSPRENNSFTNISPMPGGGSLSNPPNNRGGNAFDKGSLKNTIEKPPLIIDDPQPPLRPPADKRRPIPGEIARKAADKSVRENYRLQIAAAKSGMEKIDLSDRIWKQAVDTKDDSAAQYVLMSIAYQLASDSGQLQHAMNRADSLANYFEVDPWDLKVQAVAGAVQAAQTARSNPQKIDGDEIVLSCWQFAEEAKEAGQIEVALKTVRAVAPLAKKDPLLLREMNVFGKEIERLAARYQSVRKALDTLKDEPGNADANTLAGRWTCFESHDWDRGLPMLANSSDAALAKLAVQDLSASQSADQQLASADAWWDFAQKEKGAVKAGSLSRAQHWYDRALLKLTGTEKTKADLRLKSIPGLNAAAAPGRRGIQLGNVALAKNGTRVEGVAANANKLFDGDRRNPGGDGAAANSPAPCEWIITFDKVYLLQQIHFHFYDGDKRYYLYWMEVSADGVNNWRRIFDSKQIQTFQWQTILLNGIPVKSVKLHCTYSYKNNPFSVTEFEAYCIPPKP